jgi:hypothetical protein
MANSNLVRGVVCRSLVFGSRLSAVLFTDSGVPWLYRRVGRVRRLAEGQR